MLKPQDIVILVKLKLIGSDKWTYASLSNELNISQAEINEGVKRAAKSSLYNKTIKKVNSIALEEFIVHGIKYSFPPERGENCRGIVTGFAAYPLNEIIDPGNSLPPVWPYELGNDYGQQFSPLYKTVPQTALADKKLYEILTLIDAIRDGRKREIHIASQELKKRFFNK